MIETWFTQDVMEAVPVRRIDGHLFSSDKSANKIGVTITKNGIAERITSSCTGYFVRADGQTIYCNAFYSNNQAYCTLSSDCYEIPGQFSFFLKSNHVTLLALTGYVYPSVTGSIITPDGHEVYDLEALVTQIEECKAATEAAENVNITQSQTGNVITVTSTDSDGNVTTNTLVGLDDEQAAAVIEAGENVSRMYDELYITQRVDITLDAADANGKRHILTDLDENTEYTIHEADRMTGTHAEFWIDTIRSNGKTTVESLNTKQSFEGIRFTIADWRNGIPSGDGIPPFERTYAFTIDPETESEASTGKVYSYTWTFSDNPYKTSLIDILSVNCSDTTALPSSKYRVKLDTVTASEITISLTLNMLRSAHEDPITVTVRVGELIEVPAPVEGEEFVPEAPYFTGITNAYASGVYLSRLVPITEFWTAIANSVAEEFTHTEDYFAGQYVYHEGKLVLFTEDHEAGPWLGTDVAEITVADNMYSHDLAVGLFGQRVGNVESTVEAVEEEWASYKENIDAGLDTIQDMDNALVDLEDAMEGIGVSRWSRLNRPNLLKQDYWVTRQMPTSEVIYNTHNITYAEISQGTITYTIEDSRITTGHAVLQLQSRIYAIVRPENVTVTFAAGVATVTVTNMERTEDEISTATQEVSTDIRLWLSTVEDRKVPYGEGSRWYGSGTPYLNSSTNGQYPGDADGNSIGEIVVDLADADKITEPDGEVYDKAIQYNVTAQTAWGNADWMVFNYQGYETTWDASKTEPKDYGNIPELIPGEKYTLSCWARMVAGEKAWVSFAHGGKYDNSPYSDTTYTDYGGIQSAPVEVTGTEWQRISWTFVFEGMTGNQYTYTNGTRTDETTGDTIATITRTKNWTKRVQFGVHRKYTGILQLCGFRLVAGDLYLPTKYDSLEERVAALEARLTELSAMVLESE